MSRAEPRAAVAVGTRLVKRPEAVNECDGGVPAGKTESARYHCRS